MTDKEKHYELIRSRIVELGFDDEFAAVIASYTDTPFTFKWMWAYLNNVRCPSAEELADEMLMIVEQRDKYRQRKIESSSYDRREFPWEDE